MHKQALACVVIAADIGRDLAVQIEAGVQAAVGVVAGHGEVVEDGAVGGAADFRNSPDHDLPIGLHCHALGIVVVGADGGDHHAGAAQGGVQAAVCTIANECEIVVRAVKVRRGHHDSPVGLQCDLVLVVDRPTRERPHGRGHDAVAHEKGRRVVDATHRQRGRVRGSRVRRSAAAGCHVHLGASRAGGLVPAEVVQCRCGAV